MEKGIEELLADMLRRQDQQTELLGKLVEGQNALVEGQKAMVNALNQSTENAEYNFKVIVEELKALRKEIVRMDEFEQRLKIVESKVLPR